MRLKIPAHFFKMNKNSYLEKLYNIKIEETGVIFSFLFIDGKNQVKSILIWKDRNKIYLLELKELARRPFYFKGMLFF